jgi:hypothetical protein
MSNTVYRTLRPLSFRQPEPPNTVALEPVLFHPPRGRAWWSIPGGTVIADRQATWLERPTGWSRFDFAATRVVADERLALAFDARGQTLDLDRGTLLPASVRRGADTTLHATPNGWTEASGALDVPFPYALPWTHGLGAIGVADGMAYRFSADKAALRVRAVGDADQIRTGPHGAFVRVEGGECTHAARPGRSLEPLLVPLRDDPWLRWSDDGERLVGIDEEGVCTSIELRTGTMHRRPDAFPLDADGRLTTMGDVLPVVGTTRRGVYEVSCAVSGHLLAGPGGIVWDLAQGQRLFIDPILRFGATFSGDGPNARRWMNVRWDDGLGRVFDPITGQILRSFRLPLEPDETIDGKSTPGGQPCLLTSEGRSFDLGDCPNGGVPREIRPDEEMTDDREDPQVEFPLDLPLTGTAVVGDRCWGWSDDGLLVAVPR